MRWKRQILTSRRKVLVQNGFILTTVLGIVGDILGQAVGWYQAGEGAGFFGAIVGTIIVLVVWGMIAPCVERT
jgi:uncharacterized membrane protein YeaQ/YmgE (transglycosylase-associated protein family)